ncbi:hypothetical protein E4T56_gene7251 [Termitomyces sp. T112]|nr:hypothetical protein E4T56_gene7251 [Termitomyces sp. T112]
MAPWPTSTPSPQPLTLTLDLPNPENHPRCSQSLPPIINSTPCYFSLALSNSLLNCLSTPAALSLYP